MVNILTALDAPVSERRFGAAVGVAVALCTATVNIRSVSNDCIPNVLIPVSVLRDGDVELSEFRPAVDEYTRTRCYWAVETGTGLYSRYPIWTGIASIPVFAPIVLAADALGADRHIGNERFLLGVGRLAALAFVAMIAGGLAVSLRRFMPGRWAAALSFLAIFGTTLWHTAASQLSNQTLPIACIVLILVIVTRENMSNRRALSAGLLAGLAFAARLPAVFAIYAPLGLFLSRPDWRRFTPVAAAGALMFPAITLLYNAHAFGHVLSTGYSAESEDRFSAAFIEGATGLLFSPTCGLLVYSPFLIFGVIGAVVTTKRLFISAASMPTKTRNMATDIGTPGSMAAETSQSSPAYHLAAWLLLGFVGQWLLFSKWWAWNGALIFGGSRMLAETIPSLVLLLALTRRCGLPECNRKFGWILAFGCLSIVIFLIGTAAYDAVARTNPAKPDWDVSSDILALYLRRRSTTSLLTESLGRATILVGTALLSVYFAGRVLAGSSTSCRSRVIRGGSDELSAAAPR